jgi:endonuclease-3 related protein
MRSATRRAAVEPREALRQYFDKMLRVLGPQDWWPARTRLEMIVGAILVQNTAWQNAALALKQLKQKGMLSLTALRDASRGEIESCVRSAGFFRQKARTIRNFMTWLERACRGSLAAMFALPPQELRHDLLKITGLGPETVDAILLYAGQHPFFVADSYTRRVLARHQLLREGAGYDEAQQFLHRHLPADPELFNEYHALLVEVGKQYCKRETPLCEGCPLEEFLERGQPAVTALEMLATG